MVGAGDRLGTQILKTLYLEDGFSCEKVSFFLRLYLANYLVPPRVEPLSIGVVLEGDRLPLFPF